MMVSIAGGGMVASYDVYRLYAMGVQVKTQKFAGDVTCVLWKVFQHVSVSEISMVHRSTILRCQRENGSKVLVHF